MKNLLLYVLAGILLVTTILVLLRNPQSSLSRKEQQIGFDDPASISRITIAGRNGVLSLQQTESGWRVNDRFPVKPGLAETFVTALSTMEVKAPVPRAERKEMSRLAVDSGLLVTLYQRSGSEYRSYRVVNKNGLPGTCLLTRGSSKPVWIEIPGFSGEPVTIFRRDAAYFADQVLFSLPPQYTASLLIRNRKQNKGLFIRRYSMSDSWQAFALPDTLHPIKTDKLALEDLLNGFRRIPVKELNPQVSDSLMRVLASASPRWTIERTGFSGEKEQVLIWQRMLPSTDNKTHILDPDQAFALIGNKQRIGVVKYADLDKVLIDPEYLLQQ